MTPKQFELTQKYPQNLQTPQPPPPPKKKIFIEIQEFEPQN